MDKITLHDKTFRKFIFNSRIKEAIDEVADAINRDFEGCDDVPVVICTLNGALPFTGELFMRLKFNCELGSVKLSSYRGTESTGTVLTIQGLSEDVKGKRVIACEDIVDTGNTILALKELLLANGATEVRICTMLLKPDVYNKDVKLDYVGMEIPNDFIVGFGLDYDGLGRNYKDIYVLDKMKYYILFGPPGAGKGTHAGAIAQKYNLKHLSTGELLRAEIAAGSELGNKAKDLIAAGSLVPDEVVEGMIENAFETIKGVDGFLLDGFPRTLPQAEALDAILAKRGEKVNGVISIMIPDSLVYERIAGRAKIEGRADDASPEVIAHRIQTYHNQTEPLKEYYRAAGNYYEVNGYPGTIEENQKRVLALVETIC